MVNLAANQQPAVHSGTDYFLYMQEEGKGDLHVSSEP